MHARDLVWVVQAGPACNESGRGRTRKGSSSFNLWSRAKTLQNRLGAIRSAQEALETLQLQNVFHNLNSARERGIRRRRQIARLVLRGPDFSDRAPKMILPRYIRTSSVV